MMNPRISTVKHFLGTIVIGMMIVAAAHADTVLVEAESFAKPGGWMVDQQSMDVMGSSYLLAHGLGEPVADAAATVTVREPGEYRVWVRTRDWVANWKATGAPGKFQVLIGDKPLDTVFGTEGADWHWQDGGKVKIAEREIALSLHDLTGFEGRCDAILLTTDFDLVPPNTDPAMAQFRRRLLGQSEKPEDSGEFDLVVVGGGIAGTCAAISAARLGLDVALVQDRPVLGGNNSSEVRVWLQGARNLPPYPHIGDIVGELEQQNKAHYGPENKAAIYEDDKKIALARAEEKLRLVLGYRVTAVETAEGRIRAVVAQDILTGRRLRFAGRWFADCTGDACVGFMAGADWEMSLPGHLGSTNLWNVVDTGKAVAFPRCPWALDLSKKPFPGRKGKKPNVLKLGGWYWESGFDHDPLANVEQIRDWNFRAMYGAWDALKNVDRALPNHKLNWAAFIQGKRESRRLMGDVVLSKDDLVEHKRYADGCVPTGWRIDLHLPDKQYEKGFEGDAFLSKAHYTDYPQPYWIPLRCFYSRNVPNLFMAGRCISVTHEALGAARVMRTCGCMGECVGRAAAVCKSHGCDPRDVYAKHLDEFIDSVKRPLEKKGAVANGAGQGGLEEAQKAYWEGHYEEAAEMFGPLAKENPAAVLGLVRCQEERGKYDDAIKTLESFGEEHDTNALLLAELARLTFERGDYRKSQTSVDAALKLDAKQPLARWIQAELNRVHGRLDEAENGCRKLIRYYNDNEITDPESLRWIGQAAAQSARWNQQSDQFDFLVNELYPDALKLQADYWPAKYETGLLFLEKHNYAEAANEFRAALNINPQAAEVHAALALVWLAQHENEKAELEISRALEINPQLLDAWLAKAELVWANLQVPETLELLEKNALPLDPQSEETLGRIAACYLLLDGPATSRFERLVKQITAQNPHAGDFYFVLANALAAHNKQPQAEKYYREAIRVMSKQFGPHAQLGLLYMHMGRESEARPLLKKAFDGDPYNVRVHNMLNLLEVLDQMQTKETAHCLLRFEKDDSLLGRIAEKRVEEIFQDLSRRFAFTPPRKTAVDIFNKTKGQNGHAWFSTRVSGLPFIGTVAASTGHLVAMVSPSESLGGKRFNWVRVLRHEMVHVITLQQTHFNIPHWYTEGLAVWCEGHPRPAEWNKLLKERVPKGNIFNLDNIDSGFTRPQSSGNWLMAYCQAELYVDYMRELGGEASLKKLLDAYAEGLNTSEALKTTFGMSKDDFEKGYVEFLHKQVEPLKGLHWADTEDIAGLRKSAEERSQDAAAQAELANGYLQRGAAREAAEFAEKALKLNSNEQLAVYVKARLLMKSEKKEDLAEVAALLEKSLDLKSPEPNVLNLLAGLKLKAEQYDEAARLYALGEKLDTANPQWTRSLARVYLLSDNKEMLVEALARLARGDVDDLASRKKLAQLALARKDYPAAEQAAREGLEIDIRDADLHVALAESWSGRHNNDLAIEHWEIAVELAPEKPKLRFDLANGYLEAGQTSKAEEMLQALLKIEPDYAGAEELLKKIEEGGGEWEA